MAIENKKTKPNVYEPQGKCWTKKIFFWLPWKKTIIDERTNERINQLYLDWASLVDLFHNLIFYSKWIMKREMSNGG